MEDGGMISWLAARVTTCCWGISATMCLWAVPVWTRLMAVRATTPLSKTNIQGGGERPLAQDDFRASGQKILADVAAKLRTDLLCRKLRFRMHCIGLCLTMDDSEAPRDRSG